MINKRDGVIAILATSLCIFLSLANDYFAQFTFIACAAIKLDHRINRSMLYSFILLRLHLLPHNRLALPIVRSRNNNGMYI